MTDTNWNVHTRSVVSRLAAAESALNRSEAENARLREALERIAEGEGGILNRLTARAALAALEAP